MVAGVRPETSSAWMSAVSVSGSVPSDLRVGVAAVVEDDPERAAVAGQLDHVVVGEDLAVRAQDDARAGAGALGAADVDLHDRRQHLRRPPASTLPSAAGRARGVDDLGGGRRRGARPSPRTSRRRARRCRPRRHRHRRHRPRGGTPPPATPRRRRAGALRRWAAGRPAAWPGRSGTGCPAYGRHVGGVSGGGGSGVVSPVSVTTTTVPSGSVTILRPRWVSQKKIGPRSGTMPP